MPEPTQAIPAWVTYLSALLTPTIAILGSVIASHQWWTNRNRLKHELFDRRYEQFEVVRDFLRSIMSSGKSTDEKQFEYLSGTRGLRFVFVKGLAECLESRVWSPAVDLACLDAELEGVPVGEERSKNVKKQSELKKQLHRELKNLDETFSKYLQLRH